MLKSIGMDIAAYDVTAKHARERETDVPALIEIFKILVIATF